MKDLYEQIKSEAEHSVRQSVVSEHNARIEDEVAKKTLLAIAGRLGALAAGNLFTEIAQAMAEEMSERKQQQHLAPSYMYSYRETPLVGAYVDALKETLLERFAASTVTASKK